MQAKRILARAQYLYCGPRDYAGALAELEIARRALPNDPRLFELTGYILRRRGQQEEGLQNLQRAVELDPRNFDTLQQIAVSYQNLGAMPGPPVAGSIATRRTSKFFGCTGVKNCAAWARAA